MGATTADLNPKTLEGAKRQFVELYGSALVTNTYLRIALALVSLVAIGLVGLNIYTVSKYSQVKPLVIRIDDVGRAEAVQYDATNYQPQPPELRYFLTQFIVKHFSRLRATVQRLVGQQLESRTQPAVHRHRRRETHPVEHVVDAHRQAVGHDPRNNDVPSTKGAL